MVAYSFDRRFVEQIEMGFKRQTIRAPRRRHARVGEALQLYTAMRTKACRLIRDDVVCTRLDEVRLDLRALADAPVPRNSRQLRALVAGAALPLAINGMPIEGAARDVLAEQDGFLGWEFAGGAIAPFDAMVLYWMGAHGACLFDGVMISWSPAS